MVDWLRLFLMMFYAPVRAMSEVRDRAPLGPALLLALATQALYLIFTQRFYLNGLVYPRLVLTTLFQSLFFIAIIFVPVTLLVANLFERRGSFRLVLQQEYASLASAIFYAWAAANIIALPLAFLASLSGYQDSYVRDAIGMTRSFLEWLQQNGVDVTPEDAAKQLDPRTHAAVLYTMIVLPLFGLGSLLAVREVFRISVLRSVAVMALSAIATYFAAMFFLPLFGSLLASPFLLLMLFLLGRGYVSELTRAASARASFKKNLETATLNPADASAHYNLGLIHQQRNELGQARSRFERAIEIDADEVDAHFQLGRIARAEGRLSDAIKDFQEVVTRDEAHAQHEIWREIGATYLAAGQFDDAREALSRFLTQRQSDPEGLYLMGRAFAGLGRRREAASSMQACIEAVKTAPAYKYRTEKRWLNEAQQFLKQLQTSENLQATN
ncbi:MAG TPA: tetratricopeptide repeat protein [Pyrinomonadaceae bacterium]|jgi:tetratricopeptide (TPR) repeat protein